VKSSVVVDTGPLVALLDRTERKHKHVANVMMGIKPPLLTAEPVITEACFLLRKIKNGAPTVLRMVADGLLKVGLEVSNESGVLEALLKKYSDVPMSLADACVVRLAELHPRSEVLTFDSDFEVYRMHGRQRLKLWGLDSE
jgi:predicted nucleic acid-binding protein